MAQRFIKDPDETLDYVFDWSSWIGSDTISSYVIDEETGITLDSDSNDTDSVTVWLSGGVAGESYDVACEVTTWPVRLRRRRAECQSARLLLT